MVQFHLGKVLKVIAPGKEVVSSDASVQAIVEMWDENQLVLSVAPIIAGELKVNDVVMVDYNPIEGLSPPVPKQMVAKVLKGKQGKECWDSFRKYYSKKTERNRQKEQGGEISGIPYSR